MAGREGIVGVKGGVGKGCVCKLKWREVEGGMKEEEEAINREREAGLGKEM